MMTVKTLEPNKCDNVLKFFGKKRGVRIPTEAYEKYGTYVIAKAQKENFWSVLMRPKGKEPPPGYVYLDNY
jgi:hypothetical protein